MKKRNKKKIKIKDGKDTYTVIVEPSNPFNKHKFTYASQEEQIETFRSFIKSVLEQHAKIEKLINKY